MNSVNNRISYAEMNYPNLGQNNNHSQGLFSPILQTENLFSKKSKEFKESAKEMLKKYPICQKANAKPDLIFRLFYYSIFRLYFSKDQDFSYLNNLKKECINSGSPAMLQFFNKLESPNGEQFLDDHIEKEEFINLIDGKIVQMLKTQAMQSLKKNPNPEIPLNSLNENFLSEDKAIIVITILGACFAMNYSIYFVPDYDELEEISMSFDSKYKKVAFLTQENEWYILYRHQGSLDLFRSSIESSIQSRISQPQIPRPTLHESMEREGHQQNPFQEEIELKVEQKNNSPNNNEHLSIFMDLYSKFIKVQQEYISTKNQFIINSEKQIPQEGNQIEINYQKELKMIKAQVQEEFVGGNIQAVMLRKQIIENIKQAKKDSREFQSIYFLKTFCDICNHQFSFNLDQIFQVNYKYVCKKCLQKHIENLGKIEKYFIFSSYSNYEKFIKGLAKTMHSNQSMIERSFQDKFKILSQCDICKSQVQNNLFVSLDCNHVICYTCLRGYFFQYLFETHRTFLDLEKISGLRCPVEHCGFNEVERYMGHVISEEEKIIGRQYLPQAQDIIIEEQKEGEDKFIQKAYFDGIACVICKKKNSDNFTFKCGCTFCIKCFGEKKISETLKCICGGSIGISEIPDNFVHYDPNPIQHEHISAEMLENERTFFLNVQETGLGMANFMYIINNIDFLSRFCTKCGSHGIIDFDEGTAEFYECTNSNCMNRICAKCLNNHHPGACTQKPPYQKYL